MFSPIGATRSSLNKRRIVQLVAKCGGRVHLGCNDVRIPNYVNIDVRNTSAVDLVHNCKDLSIFPSESLHFVYSNAFFEHVYVQDRGPLLQDIARRLAPDGRVAFSGIPDFEGVARAYIERRTPGNVSPVFDLHEAYRYTHGDPEGRPSWWLAQLHKGLLDTDTVIRLLREAGFLSATVFTYRWGSEPQSVTLGFVASKRASQTAQPDDLRGVFQDLPSHIAWDSVRLTASY